MKRNMKICGFVVVLAMVATFGSVTPASAQLTFDVHERFGTGSTESIEWGDFDGDGDLDLVVGNIWYEDNYLYINNGGGTFTALIPFTMGYRQGITLASGDYDNDEDVDIAVGTCADHRIYIYANNGNGTFTLELEFDDSGCSSLAWGDYDNDGDLDLAAGEYYQDKLYINNGDGTFTGQAQFKATGTDSMAWADANNDTYLDLAVDNSLYINNGDGTFTEHTSSFGEWARDLAWGDFDNDGDPDIAIGRSQTHLYVNNGDGTFTEEMPFGYSPPGTYLAWGDYDSDGNLDLAVAGNGILKIYVNNGDGNFTASLEYELEGPLTQGDFDNDGDLDIAVGNLDFGKPSHLLHNQVIPNLPLPPPEESEVWVDDDWIGLNPGDPVNGHIFGTDAFSTIQDGIDAVESAGTVHGIVYVAAGEYEYDEDIVVHRPLTLLGSGANTTVIDGNCLNPITIHSDDVTVTGFTINGLGMGGISGIAIHDSDSVIIADNRICCNSVGLELYSASNTRLINNTISGNGDGIYLMWSHHNTIINNIIFDNDKNGILTSQSHNIISNNSIFNNSLNGIFFAYGENNAAISNKIFNNGGNGIFLDCDRTNITNNLIYTNKDNGIFVDSHTSDNFIHSNTISKNIGSGILVPNYYSSVTMQNNIIVNNTVFGIFCESTTHPTISYNDVWQNTECNYGGIAVPGEGNISADPLFIDLVNNDYHLQAGSPCIDAGNSTGAPSTDFDGNPRPIDGDGDGIAVVDMGAFEYMIVVSCDVHGVEENAFCIGENVYARGGGLSPHTEYKIWIQDDPVNKSDMLNTSEDPSGLQETITTDEIGCFSPILIWSISPDEPVTHHEYDIVVDKQDDGTNTSKYNFASDGIDSATTVGFVAPIPELPTIMLFSIGLLVLAGSLLRGRKNI
jgi:parallel beta-helix repeat protein